MAMHHSMGGQGRHRTHRQKGLDGSVPGVPYAPYRRPTTPPLGSPGSRGQGGHQHDLYNWGVPRQYHSNWNAPAAQTQEYDPGEFESHSAIHSRQQKLFGPLPEVEPQEPEFDYQRSQLMGRLFLRAQEFQYRLFQEGEVIPSMADLLQEAPDMPQFDWGSPQDPGRAGDTDPRLGPKGLPDTEEITDALMQLRHVLPANHPDLVRLETALQVRHYPIGFDELSLQANAGPGANDASADTDEYTTAGPQETMLELRVDAAEQALSPLAFDLPTGDAPIGPDEASVGLEALLDESLPGAAQVGGLEQLLEEDLFGTAPLEIAEQEAIAAPLTSDLMPEAAYEEMLPVDEIGGPIDAVMDQNMLHEAEPQYEAAPMQEDLSATVQEIFDEQIQFMANPLMMPGM